MAGAPHSPNADIVLVSWLKTVPGVDPSKVATTLPANPAVWADAGFITVSGVGGTPDVYAPVRRPVMTISAWRVSLNSEKTPWNLAMALAEHVFRAFYDPDLFPAELTWLTHRPAVLHTGFPVIEPRKVPGSTAGYAQVSFDVQIAWTESA